MIAQLEGHVVAKEKGCVVLLVGGVGYRVHVPLAALQQLPINETSCRLWTHLAVRENSQELYGFETKDELSFFELLLSVSGIGPKSALGILNLADVSTLLRAIASEDSGYLTKVSGIGKKSAEKIIIELRDKVGVLETQKGRQDLQGEAETLEALQALGYSLKESREALKAASGKSHTPQDLIKEALKLLSKVK